MIFYSDMNWGKLIEFKVFYFKGDVLFLFIFNLIVFYVLVNCLLIKFKEMYVVSILFRFGLFIDEFK